MELLAPAHDKNTISPTVFSQFQFHQAKKTSQNSLRRQYSANNYSQEQVTQSQDSKVLKRSHSSDEEDETNSIDSGGDLGIKSDFDEEADGQAMPVVVPAAVETPIEKAGVTTTTTVAEKVSKGSASDLLTSWLVNPSETEIKQALSAQKTKSSGLGPKQKARSGMLGQMDNL